MSISADARHLYWLKRFGPTNDGEDPFDLFVGVCSMLDVVLGFRQKGTPNSDGIRHVIDGYANNLRLEFRAKAVLIALEESP